MSYSIAQNTSFFTVASVLQKIISFLYFAFIARLIGVENTGVYFFAIAFTAIFTVVADFGLGAILTREAARYPDKSADFLNTIILTKIIFALATYGLIALVINLLGYSDLTKQLIYLAGLTMVFDNLHNIFYAIFRARKNLIYESIGVVGSQALTLLIGTIALLKGWPLMWLIFAYTIPSLINVIYAGYFVHRTLAWQFSWRWNQTIFKSFILMGLPFALAGIIARLYAYSDSLLMSKLLTVWDLGLWGVAYKFATAFQFIPIALSASIYPVFSSLYLLDKVLLASLYAKAYRYLFFVAWPIMAGIFVLANPVITSLYGPSYASAILPLQILVISLFFTFLTFVNGALLNAVDKQKIQTSLVAGVLFLSIILNIILLPRFQITGAAMAVIITNLLLAGAGYCFCRRYAKISFKNIFKYLNQTLWPAIIMAIVIHYLVQQINFFLTIPIGAIIYFALVFITGGLDKATCQRILIKLRLKSQ